MFVRSKIIQYSLAITIAFFPSSSIAWRVDVDPNCPTVGGNLTWQEYMSGEYPRYPGKAPSIMSVQFRFARDIGDPDIGGLPTNVCYTVRFVKETEPYYGKGYFSVPVPTGNPPDARRNLPGNPSQYEVNIHGVLLLYRNSGEVIDRQGRVVGMMVCYLSNECGSF